MIVIARDGRVPAPVEEVWAVLRRPEALPAWLAGLRQVAGVGSAGVGSAGAGSAGAGSAGGGSAGAVRVGRRLRLTGSRTGDGLDRQAEIIAWKPPTLLAWRYVAERQAGGEWTPTRPDELHIQLTPADEETRVELYAVCPAGGVGGLLLRLGPVRRWRDELARSVVALGDLFVARAPAA